jgi:hypothetical protein
MARGRRTGFGAVEDGADRPIVEVAKEASERLRARGVPHALVGGLAVAAHGFERYTKDVDLLVPSDRRDVLKTASRSTLYRLDFRPSAPLRGVSYHRRGVAVDVMLPLAPAAFLDAELGVPRAGEVPVLPAPALVYMKLVSGRAKDDADVVELLKVGGPALARKVRRYLFEHAPQLVDALERLAERAAGER